MKTKPLAGQDLRNIRLDLAPYFIQELDQLGDQSHTDSAELAVALLTDAQRGRVSDLHLEPRANGTRLRFRIDGALSDVMDIPHDQARLLANQIKALAGVDPVARYTARDSRATVEVDGANMDFRLAFMPCHHGESLVVRLLDPQRLERSLEELGLSAEKLSEMEDWLEHASGMLLAVGPTGGGKTTTIYALLHELKFANRAIVSIEDPVEYQVDGITQIKVDELHGVDFAGAVKAVLRHDPDFLVVGEIRDAMSAQSALNAAISGRVLLSTLHCRDAIGTVTALRSWGLPDHEIAEVLSMVVAQRLVRKLCPHCRRKAKATAHEAKWLEAMHLTVPSTVWTPVGCKHCQNLGYYGRTGLFEVWKLDSDDYDLLVDHATERTLREYGARKSRQYLLHDAHDKVAEGITSIAEIRAAGGLAVPHSVLSKALLHSHTRAPVPEPVQE